MSILVSIFSYPRSRARRALEPPRRRLRWTRSGAKFGFFLARFRAVISAITTPREVTRIRSPRRARSRYAGRFCLRSVTLTGLRRSSLSRPNRCYRARQRCSVRRICPLVLTDWRNAEASPLHRRRARRQWAAPPKSSPALKPRRQRPRCRAAARRERSRGCARARPSRENHPRSDS